MPYRPLILLLALLPATAAAADRVVGIGSFSRVRVDGAFDVRVATGVSPSARVTGDRSAIDAVDLHIDGNTLVVRRNMTGTWAEQPTTAARTPIVVTLGTLSLSGAVVVGGGKLAIDRMVAPRVDLSVTGAGGIALAAAQGDQVNVQVIGAGSVAVAGKAATVRLMTNGPGTIDAAQLDAGDLTVRLDGLGTTTARARYTAQVSSTGLGTVTIAGTPKCTVKAVAGSPVTCGAP
jgi:hypothetical protein